MTTRIFLIFSIFLTPLLADYYLSGGKKITLVPLKHSRNADNSNVLYFQDLQGKTYGVNDQIIVCSTDQEQLRYVAQKYQLRKISQLSDTLYLYKISGAAKSLALCQQIAQEEGIKFAHPDFILKKERRSITDHYYRREWHLRNRNHPGMDINVEEAWKYTKGKGIVSAIIDEGIDIDHEDLKANIIGFGNYSDPDSNYPDSKSGKWHGTACAGLMVAPINNIGVVGVAPEAKLIAVRYSDNDAAQDIRAFNDLMKQGVSVISNSWGSYTNLDAYNEIFKTLATKGRDGKGILIFFAAGNDHRDLDEPGIDDESESPYVISIAASTYYDKIADYSNYGSAVDFLAPGGDTDHELITTDATGRKGYSLGNYNKHFIGTSAAAPVAAGVATLILAANPDLTRDQVIEIMKKSADKVGEYPYIGGRNDYAGYGRLNAGKAVKLARSYRIQTSAKTDDGQQIDNFVYTMFQSVQKFAD